MQTEPKLYNAPFMRPVRFAYRYLRYGKLPPFAKPRFFLNNSHGSETACFVLAGYKQFTWEIVFKRVHAFCPKGIDVCIVSSGVYSDELKTYAERYGWSYIAMKRNCVTLALNSAINLFPCAQKVFKLDEDIFVTDGFFTELPRVHEEAKKDYFPAFTAPLIPINGYGYRRILERLKLVNEYAARFEYPRVSAGSHMQVESNPEVARFFWGEGGSVPQIDELNQIIKTTIQNEGGGTLYARYDSQSARCTSKNHCSGRSVGFPSGRGTAWARTKSLSATLRPRTQRQSSWQKGRSWGT